MRAVRKILAAILLLATAAVVALCACRLTGVRLGGVERALATPAGHIVLYVLLGIVAVGVLVVSIVVFAERPEPSSVRVAGNPGIEVTVSALAAVARRAAAAGEDVMIEDVEGRVLGRDRSEVRLTIEAIAFTEQGLEQTAQRMQQRVVEACETTLGTSGVQARVRFLPSKTTIETKEV